MIRIFKNIFQIRDHQRVRILMYHMVLPEKDSFKNDLVVTVENLEKQLQFISKNYQCIFFRDLHKSASAANKIILTFDDGYLNNREFLLPLLEKYGLKATIFIPTKLIEDQQFLPDRNLMTFEEIRSLDPQLIEIGLHSHHHKNYGEMTVEEAESDIKKNIAVLNREKIAFTKVLAYPYGKFPKDKNTKTRFFKILQDNSIFTALRIGNSVETFPFAKPYEVKRIDIKYSDTLMSFRWKLLFGKTRF